MGIDLVYFVFDCGEFEIRFGVLLNVYYMYFGVLMICVIFIVIIVISFLMMLRIEEEVSVLLYSDNFI